MSIKNTKQYVIKHILKKRYLKKSDISDAVVTDKKNDATLFNTETEAQNFLNNTTFFDKGYEIKMILGKHKVTLWRRKNSELFYPADEMYKTELENGDTNKIIEAFGTKCDDPDGVTEIYKELDVVFEKHGMKNNFITGLLQDYEPVVIEMTDSELKVWENNFENS